MAIRLRLVSEGVLISIGACCAIAAFAGAVGLAQLLLGVAFGAAFTWLFALAWEVGDRT